MLPRGMLPIADRMSRLMMPDAFVVLIIRGTLLGIAPHLHRTMLEPPPFSLGHLGANSLLIYIGLLICPLVGAYTL